MTKVVHCKKDKYDVYIARPSKWGNPFSIGRDGTREEVCEKYIEWFTQQYNLIDDLDELIDKTLGCWCAPKQCHGDFLVEQAALVKEIGKYGKWVIKNFKLLANNDDILLNKIVKGLLLNDKKMVISNICEFCEQRYRIAVDSPFIKLEEKIRE